MALTLGTLVPLTGNVTTLVWIAARPPADIERNLGYGAGRLGGGYWVAVLKEPLAVDDFEFDGTTLRSGGRLGGPGASDQADQQRRRVHDQIMGERGAAGYTALQQRALQSAMLHGLNRIAKVVPATAHDPALAPDVQYPMGGGGLQWKITRPAPPKSGKKFLIAAFVDAMGMAATPTFRISVAAGAPYANRHRLMQYLQSA